jgi:DnaA family protein
MTMGVPRQQMLLDLKPEQAADAGQLRRRRQRRIAAAPARPVRQPQLRGALRLGRSPAAAKAICWRPPPTPRRQATGRFLNAADAGAELPLTPGSLLVIDDIEALKAEAQVALFRAFNAARFTGLALLLAGQEPPLRLGLREDLRTRVGQTLIYEIQALSDEEKAAALRRHAIERGMLMDPAVVHYLLRHGRRDLPSLMAVLNSLDRASLEQKRPPTLPLLRELMQTSFDLEKE